MICKKYEGWTVRFLMYYSLIIAHGYLFKEGKGGRLLVRNSDVDSTRTCNSLPN